MPSPKTITAIEHDDTEIDGLQQCLDYLSTYEDPPIPVRSPKRQAKYIVKYEAKVTDNVKMKLQMQSSEQDELLMNDASSTEYHMGSDGSARSSIFSDHSNYVEEKLDSSDDETYIDELRRDYSICTIDNVVTIVRKHDRWDPKKVSFVSISR